MGEIAAAVCWRWGRGPAACCALLGCAPKIRPRGPGRLLPVLSCMPFAYSPYRRSGGQCHTLSCVHLRSLTLPPSSLQSTATSTTTEHTESTPNAHRTHTQTRASITTSTIDQSNMHRTTTPPLPLALPSLRLFTSLTPRAACTVRASRPSSLAAWPSVPASP